MHSFGFEFCDVHYLFCQTLELLRKCLQPCPVEAVLLGAATCELLLSLVRDQMRSLHLTPSHRIHYF